MAHESRGTGALEQRQLTAEELQRLSEAVPVALAAEEPAGEAAAAEAFGLAAPRHTVNVTVYPFRAIAYLRVFVPNTFPLRGTAFFISETVLATAAHNLPPNLTSIEVFVELDGDISVQPFITTDCRVAPGFAADTRQDFGAVILSQNVGHTTGWFPPPTHPVLPANGTVVTMSGYPIPGLIQLAGTGGVLSATADTLRYDLDTEHGDSGAPIFLDVAPDPILVGIHRANRGIATPITSAVSQQLLAWAAGA